jgi:apolipoprotein N-acyltransferase
MSRVVPAGVTVAWAFGVDLSPRLAFAALIALGLLPALAALLLDRAFRAEVAVVDGELHIARDRQRVHVPIASIAAVVPWRIPLPAAGASLRLRSGNVFALALEPAIATLLSTLAAAGVEVPAHPNLEYGAARRGFARRLWHHPLVKFGLFGLAPTAVLFRVHQIIAFGGVLGQYYLEGLRPYLGTLVEYWGITLLYLVLFACTLRVIGEGGGFAATWIAHGRARSVRAAVEGFCAIAYYAGVPALLAIRFLA